MLPEATVIAASSLQPSKQYSSILENKDKLIKNGSMRIRLSLISLYGQLNYTLAPEDIAFLNDLHIPLEISVFSYGGCDP